jgi:hypothetical protein
MGKWYIVLFFYLCFISCENTRHTNDMPLTEIDIDSAMKSVEAFGISELAGEITYVALETTDSSLIGNYPDVAVWENRIVVSSQDQPLMVFDKNDGHFCNRIGHAGDDPEGYGTDGWGNIPFYIDRTNGTVYLMASGNMRLLRYDMDGRFLGSVTPDMGLSEPAMLNLHYFLVSNDRVTAHNKKWWSPNHPYLVCFDGVSGRLADTVPDIVSGYDIPSSPGNFDAYIFGTYIPYGGMGTYIISFQDNDKMYQITPNAPSLWEYEGQRFLKEAFIDTIYRIESASLLPHVALNLGRRHWPYGKRFDRESSVGRISIDYMLENENLIYFHFHTGLYEKPDGRQAYCGFYNKHSGKTGVMKGERIADDIYHFLPLTVRRVSSSGEFVGLIQATDVIDWKKENALIPENRSIQSVLNMDVDDNPVVVLMK